MRLILDGREYRLRQFQLLLNFAELTALLDSLKLAGQAAIDDPTTNGVALSFDFETRRLVTATTSCGCGKCPGQHS